MCVCVCGNRNTSGDIRQTIARELGGKVRGWVQFEDYIAYEKSISRHGFCLSPG